MSATLAQVAATRKSRTTTSSGRFLRMSARARRGIVGRIVVYRLRQCNARQLGVVWRKLASELSGGGESRLCVQSKDDGACLTG